jgi:hypothetical protein
VTRDEARSRFREIVARAVAKADAQIAAHFNALKGGYIPESDGLAAMRRRQSSATKRPRRPRLLPTSKRRPKV